ncbi:hypothetical protein JEQ12_010824 [Ovis aries]|uniref:Uncharacterized protein n=1 Tax=Ovis aries TaxID=9940 RepID=A0A835ZNB3_SHEEP|nr:hypothetical protein JEQ12_010824 [Ovis aries]
MTCSTNDSSAQKVPERIGGEPTEYPQVKSLTKLYLQTRTRKQRVLSKRLHSPGSRLCNESRSYIGAHKTRLEIQTNNHTAPSRRWQTLGPELAVLTGAPFSKLAPPRRKNE